MATLNTDKAWISYGKENAYYGVLAHDEFLDENLSEESLNKFFDTGFSDIENLFELIHSNFGKDFSPKTILDFGCGTGRLVIPFSKRAESVVGLDISDQMLAAAEENAKKFKVDNASFVLSDNELSGVANQKFDLIHSLMVFQHINVKRGEKIFQRMIDLLNPNGIGAIHMTYYSNKTNFQKRVNYFRYRVPFFNSILNVLRGKKMSLPLMQMNSYDMNKILCMLQKAGIKKSHLTFTDHGGYLGLILLFQK
jgi:ubiquinone/menaquinone biosynthesis C-methylase UbiE